MKDPLKGFKHLVLSLTDSPTETKTDNKTASVGRFLYYKKHVAAKSFMYEEEDVSGATLFVINIPFYFDVSSVMEVFSVFGAIRAVLFVKTPPLTTPFERIELSSADPSCQSAHIVYESSDSIDQALSLPSEASNTVQPTAPTQHILSTGLPKWVQEYKKVRPETKKLEDMVDRFMMAFDQLSQEAKKAKRAAAKNKVDGDGWILVTSKKSNPRVFNPSSALSLTPNKKRKREHIITNFYRFQQRMHKQDKLVILRQKFEDDKKKIAMMKATRKFKPL